MRLPSGILRLLPVRRVLASFRSLPLAPHWKYIIAGLAGTAAVSLPFGFATGFFYRKSVAISLTKGVVAIFFPVLVEEVIFRAAFLPHPAVDPPADLTFGAFTRAAVAPTVLYVANHLLYLALKPNLTVFKDVRFLTLAGVLGTACAGTYWATKGSLWAASVVHWVSICAWSSALGGAERLGIKS